MKKSEHIHKTIPVKVWVNVDVGIADFVIVLNKIKGVRTHASCQGTLGEGGAHPYIGHVMVTWDSKKVLASLKKRFIVEIAGKNWGYVLKEEIDYPLPSDFSVKTLIKISP